MVRIFIADDSISYRNQIEKHIAPLTGVEVVGSSRVGSSTFSIIENVKPDILVVELSSTTSNGFLLLDEIKSKSLPLVSIIALLQSKTQTTRAFNLGVTHVVEKNATEKSDDVRVGEAVAEFLDKQHPASSGAPSSSAPTSGRKSRWVPSDSWQPRAIVIASSTGGPPALETIFKQMRPPQAIPIFIAQHMPELFTRDLALRLATVSRLEVREAIDGEEVSAGTVYIAPGNFHMRLRNNGRRVSISLDQADKLHSVRPAADYLFQTAASIYGKDCLGIVLTGMGMDGAEGSVQIKKMNGRVVIQDKESSAVWGMPGSVHAAGAYDAIEGLDAIAGILKTSMGRLSS